MKTELEIGDEIVRFEVGKKIEYLYVIDCLTKKLAKSREASFKNKLIYDTSKPNNITDESKLNIIAELYLKSRSSWTATRYYLIKKGSFKQINNL
jgi:hypothetical protein